MTYAEYSKQSAAHDHAISIKRSLLMTVRANHACAGHFRADSKRGRKRDEKIQNAEAKLQALTIPPKPEQPIGYEVLIDGDYEGFLASDDLDRIKRECAILQEMGELPAGKLTYQAKPRWNDIDSFRYTD